MIPLTDKKQDLIKQISLFANSDQTVDDYCDLIIVAHRSLKQGTGLVWYDVKEAIKGD